MKRILFVDDEICILQGIRRMFYSFRTSWDMHFASSGQEALGLCEAHSFDVVVSDMHMPGMDGSTLLGQIRDRFPGIVRIALSGYPDLMEETQWVDIAYIMLSKPCGENELQSAIEQALGCQHLAVFPEMRAASTEKRLPGPAESLLSLADVIES